MKLGVGVVLDVLYQKVTECVSSLDGIIESLRIRFDCFPEDKLLKDPPITQHPQLLRG